MIFYDRCYFMALEKKYRLKTKDVIFLTRKKQFFPNWYFGFFYIDQYKNLSYNQTSCHITLKYSKRSTDRNILKRAVINCILKDKICYNSITWKFYKIFIILNKSKLDNLKQNIESFDKKAINDYTIKEFQKSFSNFKSYLWRN
jgi:RNase P protein component